MRTIPSFSRVLEVSLAVLGLIAAPCYGELPDVVFQITAEAGPVGAEFEVLADWGIYDPDSRTWVWILPAAHEFWSADTFLGSLDGFDAKVVGDPELSHGFLVQAGPSATHYYICSGFLGDFDEMIDPAGWVSVSLMLTDFDGDGATLEGSYIAQYNGWACDPSGPQGTTFVECPFSMSAGPFETVTATCDVPPTPIAGSVHDMSALTSFELSACDIVSGTSTFVIIPCYGDLDGDGQIGLSDLAQLLANYGETSEMSYEDGDLDGDADVDLADLAALLAVYGTTCE
jgi:hypothetical protein